MSDNFYEAPKNEENLNTTQETSNSLPVQENKVEEFVDTNSAAYTKRRQRMAAKRKNRKIKSIITLVIVLILSISITFGTIYCGTDYLGIRVNGVKECNVEIKMGASTAEIAKNLQEAGAINSQLFFRIFCKLGGYDGTFKYGVYNFSSELGYKDIAQKLQTEGESAATVKVMIPERSSIDDIMRILEDKGVCTKADFKKAMRNGNYNDISFVKDIPTEKVYYRFEGYLFPDTYHFYNYDSLECAELAIRKMLKRTEEVLTNDLLEQIQKDNKTLHEVLTMASIVELEASASVNEMPKVAAVFYNRLVWDEPQRLGSSPTAEYPYGEGRYDTNKVEGLPPGPLCSPSIAAIKASVYPEKDFPYTYFVTDSEMEFYYNKTYREHNQTIARLKSQGKWLG